MVSVLAVGPKIYGFRLSRGDGVLRAITIRGTPSFGGEVTPSAPCRKFLRHFKDLYEEIFRKQNSAFYSPRFSDLLLDSSASRISREGSGRQIRYFPLSTSFNHGSQNLSGG
jgi:hypothetical protein